MKRAIIFLALMCVLSACRITEYVYVNSCAIDVCEEPSTVEEYILAYECKAKIVESCKR